MTSPVVGRVDLEVGVTTDEIKKHLSDKLTKQLHDDLLPQISKMNDELHAANAELGKMQKASMRDLVKQMGFVADEHARIVKSKQNEVKAERALTEAKIAHAEKTRQLTATEKRYNQQIKENGKATATTENSYKNRQAAVAKALRTITDKERALREVRAETARLQAADDKKRDDQAKEYQRQQIAGFEKVVKANATAIAAMIAKGETQTKAQERRDEAQAASHARMLAAQGKAEDRATARAERQAARAEKRRKNALRTGALSPLTSLGEIGRAAFNLSPKASTGAFAGMIGGAGLAAGGLASLSKVAIGLPAVMTTAAAGIGVLAAATHGFGDAISALASGDTKKWAEEFAKLGPNAQQAALQIETILPHLHKLRMGIQDAFFANTDDMLRGLASSYIPIFDKIGTGIATSMNKGMALVTKTLEQPAVREQIIAIGDDINKVFENIIPIVEPLLRAFLDLTEVGMDFLPGMADKLVDMAQGFADFISKAKDSGQLKEWFEQGLHFASLLGEAIWQIGKFIMALAPIAEKVLPPIVHGLDAVVGFLSEHPNALYGVLAAVIGLSLVKWAFDLAKYLQLVAVAFGTTLPAAIGKTTASLAGLTGASILGGKGGKGKSNPAIVALGDDIVLAGGKAEKAKGKFGWLKSIGGKVGKVAKVGGIATLAAVGVGAGMDIFNSNREAGNALEDYTGKANTAREAQEGLNRALLESRGAWDSAAQSAGLDTLNTQLEAATAHTREPSFLDKYRDTGGDLLGDLFNPSSWSDQKVDRTLADDINANNKVLDDAKNLIKEKMGNNEEAFVGILSGERSTFDQFLTQFNNMDNAVGDNAARALEEMRRAIVGVEEASQAALPALLALGTDPVAELSKLSLLLENMPTDVPIKITDTGGQAMFDLLQQLNQAVTTDNEKNIQVTAPLAPEVVAMLQNIGYLVKNDNNKLIFTKIDPGSFNAVQAQLMYLNSLVPGGTEGPAARQMAFGAPNIQGPIGASIAPQLLGGAPPIPPPKASDIGATDIGGPAGAPNPADALSESDRKQMIDESIKASDFYKDPFANMPGGQGQAPMNVQVQNFPDTYGMGGALTVGGGGGGVPITPGPNGTWTSPDPQWAALIARESGGNPRIVQGITDANSGGNEASGLFQIAKGTWAQYGGTSYAPTAGEATPQQQSEIAAKIFNASGGQPWGAVPGGGREDEAGLRAGLRNVAPLGRGTSFGGAPYGLPAGTNIGYDQTGFPTWVYELGRQFNVKPSTYAGHQEGAGVNQGIDWSGDPEDMKRFAKYMQSITSGGVEQVIYMDPNTGEKIGAADGKIVGPGTDQPGYYAANWGGHQDHVHTRISKDLSQSALGYGQDPNLFGTANMTDPLGNTGYFEVDQEAVDSAADALRDAADAQADANRELAVLIEQQKQGLASENDVIDARKKVTEADEDVADSQRKYQEALQGDWKDLTDDMEAERKKREDYGKYPYGSIQRMIHGGITGAGGSEENVVALMGPLLGAIGQPIGSATGDAVAQSIKSLIPDVGTPTATSTSVDKLAKELNPLTTAAAAGVNVPDYTRAGGGAGAAEVMLTDQGVTAAGQLFSDTSVNIDRSFTDMEAANKARHDQQMSVLNSIAERVGAEVLQPVVTASVTEGINGIATETATRIGVGVGSSAAPIIADAVERALAGDTSGIPPDQLQTMVNNGLGGLGQPPLFDEGGLWPSGTAGMNLSGSAERVLSPSQTSLFDAGLLGGWNAQALQQQFAAGDGMGKSANASVGADFFGVSNVPILGPVVNGLIGVLLDILGVEIEARDTMMELTDEFREFRGDQFAAFDAAGRMMNDTSAMLDRSSTDQETVAQERIRIFTQVIEGLVDYVVKIFVDIVSNLLNTGFGMLGGAAGGIIDASSPLGFLLAPFVEGAIGSLGTALTTLLGSVATSGFGALTTLILGALAPLLGGLFGGVFDNGGVAYGKGLMPKATIAPERVLSPSETASFERLVTSLERGEVATSRNTTIYAPFTVQGGESAGRAAHARLLTLMS